MHTPILLTLTCLRLMSYNMCKTKSLKCFKKKKCIYLSFPGKGMMPLGGDDYNEEHGVFDTNNSSSGFFSSSRSSPKSQSGSGFDPNTERFSRKVFVGGLPPDIDEDEITASFRRFGPLVVDWPHKAESKSYFPPKGYAFLLFQVGFCHNYLLDRRIFLHNDLTKYFWG